jgi:Gnt-I system low-affinity gluconate transporter
MEYTLFYAVGLGIVVLLCLILRFKVPAFISLLIASIVAGLVAGLNGVQMMDTVQKGMGSTLGFVATVVGLGSMFGALLEKSGGAKAIAHSMLQWLGLRNAPLSMVITGFIVAIPVFFDVAFIILIPVLYALQKSTGKSLLLYAIPLLSGLAVAHSFIPPTPGPVAVADIVGVDLGWVIIAGIVVGIPTTLVSGLLYGKYIASKLFVEIPAAEQLNQEDETATPDIGTILYVIAIPLVLIVCSTVLQSQLLVVTDPFLKNTVALLGHPFSALIIANIIAWYILGIRKGYTSKELLDITTKSMAPAGTIILVTGAGGVFKQVLVDTGAGKLLAESLTGIGLPIVVFAFVTAALIRIIQGSATVAMITSAGLVAPLLVQNQFSPLQLAALVTSIASGATILSHVNDSGFWLVKQYLGMTEQQTFQSWTVMTIILAFTGFVASIGLFWLG